MGVELENQVRQSPWRLGPLRIKPAFSLNEAGFDSNVFYGSAGENVEDYTFTAGPKLNIYLPLEKKLILEIDESPQYLHYFETAKERAWNNYFRGHAHLALNRFFITAGWGLSNARERWSTEIDARPRRKENSLSGSILWQPTKRISYLIGLRRLKYDYEDISYEVFDLAERLNRTEDYLNFTAYYQLSSRARFFIDYERGDFDFESLSSFKDSRSDAVYGGIDFAPKGRIRGRINLGYKTFDARDPGAKDYSGFVGDTQVSFRAFRSLDLKASYKRGVQFSLWYDNNFFLEDVYGAGASFYPVRKIRLDYNYLNGKNDYRGAAESEAPASQVRLDKYQIHSAGVYFMIQKDIGLGIVYSRWTRDSNLAFQDDKRDFVGANLTYDF